MAVGVRVGGGVDVGASVTVGEGVDVGAGSGGGIALHLIESSTSKVKPIVLRNFLRFIVFPPSKFEPSSK